MYIVRQIGRLWAYISKRNAAIYDIVHKLKEDIIILFNGDAVCKGMFPVYLRKKAIYKDIIGFLKITTGQQ